ncbi:hypothetical protein Q5O12_26205, partial [Klebsiella pneumoniae]|nr:hypothetical protein [Klebsiella pneumoniae]
VVLTSLPFSMILLLMMWGLHKAFYLESQKQIAQLHSLAPVSASRKGRGGWRQRLSQAVHFPSRDEVYRFLESNYAEKHDANHGQQHGVVAHRVRRGVLGKDD